jgi:hypothetical protein
MRKQAVRYVTACAMAGGMAAGALVLTTATSASAHFTCADGTTTTVDDPAVACIDHNGIAGGATPTTAEPADHDHAGGAEEETPAPTEATPTTKKATTPTTAKAAPSAVKAAPTFTG